MNKIHLSSTALAQTAHFFIASTVVLLPMVMKWTHHPKPGAIAIVAFGVVKEFAFDPLFEDQETSGGFWGGVLDFTWYMIGMAATLLVVHFR